jgi:hypothetical protein
MFLVLLGLVSAQLTIDSVANFLTGVRPLLPNNTAPCSSSSVVDPKLAVVGGATVSIFFSLTTGGVVTVAQDGSALRLFVFAYSNQALSLRQEPTQADLPFRLTLYCRLCRCLHVALRITGN